ncbi:hypothetical protein OJAV_G00001220 [Oryzias javanicus]|uniref:NAD(P)(+)--arginine ADP-ribosyltransferase n=1 Tax=Oryzias javanicus TaxID=123683 RepID=A0A3S2N755_ORYJA|nr:hypothetical protein OJAV_G00001220 [Oryzias javanicus]
MTFWAGVLLMFGAFMVTAEGDRPLDMAVDSVDDMYDDCEDKMLKLVKKEFLESEKSTHKNFSDSWNEAEMYYKGFLLKASLEVRRRQKFGS